MNIPADVARAQGKHGIKGGRPKLELTDKEKSERRRLQHEAYRRRKGVPPRTRTLRPCCDFQLAVKAIPFSRDSLEWRAAYCDLWDAKVILEQSKTKPLKWKPQVEPERSFLQYNDPCPCDSGLKARKCCHPFAQAVIAPVLPGRNDPCSCGSGRKFKKCCG